MGLRALRKQRSVACLHKDRFFYVRHSALKNANKSADFRNFTDFLQKFTGFEFFNKVAATFSLVIRATYFLLELISYTKSL